MGTSSRTCREAALSLLARRAQTSRELTTKLRRKGFGEDEVARTLGDLVRQGWLDDARTAASLVRSGSAVGRGRRRIASDLHAKGITGAAAGEALGTLSPEDERAALRAALAKKERSLPERLTGRERSKKLFDHLVRRGFSAGAVLEELRTKGDRVDDDDE